ncbi:hypothetical protein [Streptomyces sp. cmx-4-9]|uniref:hypothetical protein n=1 Tax=Streptomyces sp. cmx-4-9 TaxID=2790941 RepID=UPI0039807DC1
MSMGTVLILSMVVAMITALALAPPAGRTASDHGAARHRRTGAAKGGSAPRSSRRLRNLPRQRTADSHRTPE